MEEVLKQLNELCRDTLVDNLGMVFTAAGEGWLEARMPIDRRTCRPDGALHGGANMALAETVGRSFEFYVGSARKPFPRIRYRGEWKPYETGTRRICRR